MLSVHAGHDSAYMTDQVAGGRESYYLDATTTGEPPGKWGGKGAEKMGLQGEVDADVMEAVYGRGLDPRDPRFQDPATREQSRRLGSRPGNYKTPDAILDAKLASGHGVPAERLAELRAQATAGPVGADGSRFDEGAYHRAVAEEAGILPEAVAGMARDAARSARQSVPFIDATFSPVKSFTVLVTSFERAELDAQRAAGMTDDPAEKAGHMREAAKWAGMRHEATEALWAANGAMLDTLSDRAGFSQTGRHTQRGAGAGRFIDSPDWVVASFHQSDSRDHDPQQHVHNAILNKVVCADGVVRTLDSRGIHRWKQAAGTIGDRVLELELTKRLGVKWTMRPDGTAREIDGVDQAVMDLFSERSGKITKKVQEWSDRWETEKGYPPPAHVLTKMRQDAALATRSAKSHTGETAEQRLDRWDQEARTEIAGGLRRVAERMERQAQAEREPAATFSPSGVIAQAVAAAQAEKSTFSKSELIRQILLALPDNLPASWSTGSVRAAAERLADQALADADLVVQVTGHQPTADVPEQLKRKDGASAYATPEGPRYSATGHIVAEQALARSAVERGRPAVDRDAAEAWCDANAPELGADQRAAVVGLLAGGAALSTLPGAAGAGKSHVLGVLGRAWHDLTGGRVVGLAVSEIATQNLREEGLEAVNTRAWLNAQERLARGRGVAADWRLQVQETDKVVVDESSMVATPELGLIQKVVDQAGAATIAAGDHHQLGAIGAGGALELLVDRADTYHLTDVRRFQADWEKRASLGLRRGDQEALVEYERRGRVFDEGTAANAIHAAAKAYLGDSLAGKSTLVMTGSNEDAAKVNATVRDRLVELGRVEAGGFVSSHADNHGNVIGKGDLVQARAIDRSVGVLNRERYVVEEVRADGSVRVKRESDGEPRELPASYAKENLVLGYAGTVHAAQGLTVDTGHAVVSPGMSQEHLYVAMTRGRECNSAHVATKPEVAGEETGESHPRVRVEAGQVLRDIVEQDNQDTRAALLQNADSARAAGSMATIHARTEDAVRLAGRERTDAWLDNLEADGKITADQRAAFGSDQATEGLSRLLRTVEQAGHDAERVLRDAVGERTLDGLQSVAQGVHSRITKALEPDQLVPVETDAAGRSPADLAPGWKEYVEELHDAADERRQEIAVEVTDAQPQWARETLGPVPADVVEAAEWSHKAGVIGAYREMTGFDREDAAIGPAKGYSTTEARQAWHAAWVAAGCPEAGTAEKELSEGALRNRVRAWERTRDQAPEYVDDRMAATGQEVQKHRQSAAIFRAEAEAAGEADREDLLAAAEDVEVQAEELAKVEADLAKVAETRAEWLAENAWTEEAAQRAEAELAARGKPLDAEEDRVSLEEWLELEAEARVEDDAFRPITETNAPAEVWDEELQDLVQVGDSVEDGPVVVEPVALPAADVEDAVIVEDVVVPVQEELPVDELDAVDAELVDEDLDEAAIPGEPVAEVEDAEIVEDVQDDVVEPATEEAVVMPPGVPSVAEAEVEAAKAAQVAAELDDRRSQEQAQRGRDYAAEERAEAQEYAAREDAWRADAAAQEAAAKVEVGATAGWAEDE